MNIKLYTPVYALTLLLSAALLFSVQPMFSKMVLPLLGGTAQVWNTAMVFFQTVLLAGYAYAHFSTRLFGLKAQALLHISLLLVFMVGLPIALPHEALPPTTQDPTLWQLLLMTSVLGGPFFILAGSAPLLQRWFSYTDHPDADNPYFLYGASNLGSMSALLAYPVLIEPLFNLTDQTRLWALGYIILTGFVLYAYLLIRKNSVPKLRATEPAEKISLNLRLKWLVLAFIPSSLMLGVTTYITTDIASVPLLWIMPLALYLGTFIIVFARRQFISPDKIFFVQGLLILILIVHTALPVLDHLTVLVFHMVLFFVSALACHTVLANSRPAADNLTGFYLTMSIGGALGGAFNALLAPHLFVLPIEYGLMLAAACFVRYAGATENPIKNTLNLCAFAIAAMLSFFPIEIVDKTGGIFVLFGLILSFGFLIKTRWLFAIAASVFLLSNPPGLNSGKKMAYEALLAQKRNFFGVIRVIDIRGGERIMLNGTTTHGSQALSNQFKLIPLTYYGKEGPLGDVFEWLDGKAGPQDIAVLGLGTGTTACHQNNYRHFDFYEINPNVVELAENSEYFTYLSDCGSPYQIIMGDGRLSLKEQPDHKYDMILIDAFSSDNIPVHLITQEAVQLGMDKLKKDSVLVYHISNRHLDLEPVLSETAKKLGLYGYATLSVGGPIEDTDLKITPSHYFVFTENQKIVQFLEEQGWSPGLFREGISLWTDQYSNIISIFGGKSRLARAKKHAESVKKDAKKIGESP